MNLNPAFIQLAVVSLALISFSSLVIFLLRKKNPENSTFQKVSTIIKSWWWIIGFVLICLGLAPLGLLFGFGALSIFSLFEFQKHSRLLEIKKYIAVLIIIAILCQYASLFFLNWSAFFALPLIFIFLGFPLLIIISAHIEKLTEIFAHYVGLILIFHLLAYLPCLFIFEMQKIPLEQAFYLIFFLILLTELNDILQFLCGKAFGKRKTFPLISPNKTEAGFIGGILGTTVLSGILFHYSVGFSMSKAGTLGLIISLSGILGDLCFSAVKRYFGTKDFSNTLPGHGGILDRLDSLIFTTPCVFYFLYFTS